MIPSQMTGKLRIKSFYSFAYIDPVTYLVSVPGMKSLLLTAEAEGVFTASMIFFYNHLSVLALMILISNSPLDHSSQGKKR